MKKKQQQKAGKVKSKNLFMTCKFCVNAEKPKYLASATTSIYEIQDTQQEGGRQGRGRQRELSCEQLVEWQNEETNQLGVQGEKQRERGEGQRRGEKIYRVRGSTEIEWKSSAC